MPLHKSRKVDLSRVYGHVQNMTAPLLDLSGFKCPLPALKTRKALKALAAGDRLEVRCTDPLAAIDIPNLVRETGDHLVSQQQNERHIIFVIAKGPAAP
jgi:tRNA 2-thiouridine synthesizing protein A